jgi:hypothetical protein
MTKPAVSDAADAAAGAIGGEWVELLFGCALGCARLGARNGLISGRHRSFLSPPTPPPPPPLPSTVLLSEVVVELVDWVDWVDVARNPSCVPPSFALSFPLSLLSLPPLALSRSFAPLSPPHSSPPFTALPPPPFELPLYKLPPPSSPLRRRSRLRPFRTYMKTFPCEVQCEFTSVSSYEFGTLNVSHMGATLNVRYVGYTLYGQHSPADPHGPFPT